MWRNSCFVFNNVLFIRLHDLSTNVEMCVRKCKDKYICMYICTNGKLSLNSHFQSNVNGIFLGENILLNIILLSAAIVVIGNY